MLPEYTTTLSHVNATRNIKMLTQGWDWPVAGCKTLSEYVNKVDLDASSVFFWLHENETPVAFFGFSLHPDFNSFEIGTFITPEHRGRGINSIIKFSSIAAFQTLNLPLVATVLEENNRSLKAMRKISGKHGLLFDEQYRNTKSYLFELHDINVSIQQINTTLLTNIYAHKIKLNNAHNANKVA